MVYAIVKAGGRQEKVSVGDIVVVNRLKAEAGSSVELPALLLVDGEKVTSDAKALALHRHVVMEQPQEAESAKDLQDVGKARGRRAGNDGNATWIFRQRALARKLEESFAIELVDELAVRQVPRALSRGLEAVTLELVLALRAVGVGKTGGDHLLPDLRFKAHVKRI